MTEQECNVCNEIENGLYEEFSWLFRDDGNYIKMVNIVENAIDKYSQNKQNQKAIECLKEVRKSFIDTNNLPDLYFTTISLKDLYTVIDNKIKELEEGK